jgi:hypothetical protein
LRSLPLALKILGSSAGVILGSKQALLETGGVNTIGDNPPGEAGAPFRGKGDEIVVTGPL